jgi:2-dehydro-3-deoxygalactonokinase
MTGITTILADWGTTNLRAVALGRDGTVVDRRDVPLGLRRMGDRTFADVFDDTLGGWRSGGDVPVLLSGMVGSRQGWIEAPYCPCPVTASDLAGRLTAVPERENTWIVPGVCLPPDGANHDVMRGEEVQIFGALDMAGRDSACLCLPGTHSKWVRVEAGAITRFATAMTGEVFAVLTDHSILGTMMTDGAAFSEQAFRDGLDRSGEPGGLLRHLFTVRADSLFDTLAADRARDFLSGILIGHEVRELSGQFKTENEEIVLVGTGALGRCYAIALGHFGIADTTVSAEDATLRGQVLIWGLA